MLWLQRFSFSVKLIFTVASICLQLKSTSCLRDLVLTVPPAVSLGETVTLNCSYHLQGENLYAIKLYKGRNEFMTYAAERQPPLRSFPLKGIHIGKVDVHGDDPKKVDGISVTLRDINLFTTGLFGCEASAEESFHTALVRKQMTVLVKPEDRPSVTGFKTRHRVGDTLQMTCYINNTFPAANLTWFVTGKRVGENSAKYKVLTSPTTGLKVARTDLRLLLEPNHFRNGLLIAKCIASMFTMHWQSTDISIKEESPTLASVVDHSNGAKNETEIGASTKNKVGTGFNIPATSGSTNLLHAKGCNFFCATLTIFTTVSLIISSLRLHDLSS